MSTLICLAGWAGTFLVLLSYLLISRRRTTADSLLYQGLNIAGSVGLLSSCLYNHAIPAAALNVAWMGIGIVTLWARGRQLAHESRNDRPTQSSLERR